MANGSDYEKYTYRVIWSKEDNEFVGLCDEFRSLSYLSEIESEALDGIKNLIKEISFDIKNSLPIPENTRIWLDTIANEAVNND